MNMPTLVAAALTLTAVPALAQEEGKIPTPLPLVAHFTDGRDHLVIGGSPEAEGVASVLGTTIRARIVGASGSVPLLAQGMIALAVLPRDLTVNERAATRRFTGARPLALQISKSLTVFARRDASGAIDEHTLPLLQRLLSDEGQAALVTHFGDPERLPPAALADARASMNTVAATRVNEAPAGYRLADGRRAIIGSDTLTTLLPDLLAAFAKQHPAVGFAPDLRGSSLAIPALTAGTSAIAPMGREAWQDDIDAFRQVKGYAPIRIRIAYASHGPRADGKTPPAIYVNSANPLAHLSLAQIQRIFAAGAPGGDIAQWSGLGVRTGQWADATIHVYGGREDGGFAEAMRISKLNGLPFSARYRSMANGKAILRAVASDPFGIGYSTWMDSGEAPAGVRIVPLGKSDTGPFVLPDDVSRRGAWPISYFFNIYVDRAPNQRLDPDVRALLAYILSDAGQEIISRYSDEEDGYVALDPQDLAAERKIVEAL